MSDPFNGDEELLARLVRDAGDPSAAPDPQYADTLRATILDRVADAVRTPDVSPIIALKRNRTLKRIAKLAVAATVLVAIGISVFWMTLGDGSASIAFAQVAEALENARTATYDCNTETKNPIDGSITTTTSKGYFLAPSHERVESSSSFGSTNDGVHSVMILDCLAAKGLTLLPAEKRAITVNIEVKEKSTGGTASMFDMVRRLIRKGSTDSAETVESLGKKEIDGRVTVGFRRRTNMVDVALWADPETARLVRVETGLSGGAHSVLSNFRYDEELDPSLFSLEPPPGYTVENVDVPMPVEADLIHVLRFVAEHNDGVFPEAIGMHTKEFMQASRAQAMAESQKLLATPEVQELMAKVMARHGKDHAAGTKAWMKEWTKMAEPITRKLMQKRMQGVMFYGKLTPENDPHYVGGGVKLDTPDRPIFWYKPTGADKYRVVYADLSVKEVDAAKIKTFPEDTVAESSEGNTAPTANGGVSVGNEKDLIEMLRFYAAQQDGLLPPTLDAGDVESGIKAPLEKKIKAKYGSSSREAKMKAMQDPEFMKRILGSGMKCLGGLGFLRGLKPENDSHYAGKDVKLGTPDRPIFWYKPTGAEKYRVIHADLNVKEMTPDEVKKLHEAKAE